MQHTEQCNIFTTLGKGPYFFQKEPRTLLDFLVTDLFLAKNITPKSHFHGIMVDLIEWPHRKIVSLNSYKALKFQELATY